MSIRAIQLGIRGKSVALFCLCALLPLAVISIAAMLVVHHLAERLVTNDLAVASRGTLENLERFFADRIVDLDTWSDLRVMQDVLIDDQEGEVRRDLGKLLANYPYFAELSVLNAEGQVVAATRDSKIGTNLAGASLHGATMAGRSYQGAVAPSAVTDATILTFAQPIRAGYDRDVVIGTLIGVISWDEVRNMLSSVPLMGKPQDRNHLLILRSLRPAGVLYRTPDSGAMDLAQTDGGPRAAATGIVDIGDRSYLTVIQPSKSDGRFADPGWELQAAISVDVAFADVNRLRHVLIAIGLLACAGVLAVGWLGASDLVRPITALIDAMRRLAAGDDRTPVPALDRRDEIGAMADALQTFQRAARERALEQQELLQAKLAAEKADRAKSDFLATMSHELRTPLNAIIGFAELIRGLPGGSDKKSRHAEYAADIHTSGKHLLEIVNDLLDLSKAEAGAFALSEESVDPLEIAAAAAQMVTAQAQAAGLTLRNLVPHGLPQLRADERRLKQILINLLSNAVKFTPNGGFVRLSARRTGEGGLCFIVQDNGIGMSPDQVPVALAPFGQINTSFNRRHSGTGLGLPLAKRFTEAHGGNLAIESRLGFGTTITVSFPPDRIVEDSRPTAVTLAAG